MLRRSRFFRSLPIIQAMNAASGARRARWQLLPRAPRPASVSALWLLLALARGFDNPPPRRARRLSGRRSIGKYWVASRQCAELGEFLYRVGRLKALHQTPVPTPGGLIPMELAPRPYAGGGAWYGIHKAFGELDIPTF